MPRKHREPRDYEREGVHQINHYKIRHQGQWAVAVRDRDEFHKITPVAPPGMTTPKMDSDAIWMPRWMLEYKLPEGHRKGSRLGLYERNLILLHSILLRSNVHNRHNECWQWTGAMHMGRPTQLFYTERVNAMKALAAILSGHNSAKVFDLRRYCPNPHCMNPRHIIPMADDVNTPLPYAYAQKWVSTEHYPWTVMIPENEIRSANEVAPLPRAELELVYDNPVADEIMRGDAGLKTI